MPSIMELETKRLKLRQWKDSDYPVFAEMNSDPEVMKYYPDILCKSESDKMTNKIRALITEKGWGFWAVEENKNFIGFVGLNEPDAELPFSPCVEVGWRLTRHSWGKGYATEASKEALKFAFGVLNLNKIYSFATAGNSRSIAVMERLNMVNTERNFEHPSVPVGSPFREHVLYELTYDRWLKTV